VPPLTLCIVGFLEIDRNNAIWRDGSEFRFEEPKAQTSGSTSAVPKLIGGAA
jgi:hypothetical protein